MEGLFSGLAQVLAGQNLAATLLGAGVGVLFGAMPGVGPCEGVALLLPLTYVMSPLQALLFLTGLYCGGTYGGSIAAILFKIPGSSEAVMTTLDGYELARKGQPGRALGFAIAASCFGGLFSTLIMLLLAPVLAGVALSFGPAEYFALCVLGMATISSIGTASPTKAAISGMFGLLMATVGVDGTTGAVRYTFGLKALLGGIPFISSMIGLFAATELLNQVSSRDFEATATVLNPGRVILPNIKEFLRLRWTLIRGAILGTWVGILPGVGATTAAIIGYSQEVRFSKDPGKFGTGAVEGIVAPEAANNAATGGAMIPLLSLGIPGSGTTAVMVGAFLIHGLRLGPLLLNENPVLIYSLFFGMLLANLFMGIVGIGVSRIAGRILRVPYPVLAVIIASFCFTGAQAIGDVWGIWFVLCFSVIGFFMTRFGFPTAPVIIGYVLGPIMEQSLRRAFTIAQGNIFVMVSRPITATLLGLSILSALWPVISRKRTEKGAVSA